MGGTRRADRALVEAYRTVRGPRQRVVAWLGTTDDLVRVGVRQCVQPQSGQRRSLFGDNEPEWVEVDLKRDRVKLSRKFGGVCTI